MARKISYDPLWKKLFDMKLSKGDLCEKASIARSTVTKMANGEKVALDVIEKICNALDCEIYEVIECRHDSQSSNSI